MSEQMQITENFYGLGNDYMFHAIMQCHQDVLEHLVATLMEIPLESIESCVLNNPIVFGQSIDAKKAILDLLLTVNGKNRINIELQMWQQHYWQNRSIFYLFRGFDQLKQGETYSELGEAHHIGILNFSLFKESPKFFRRFKIMDTETGEIYTDHIGIRILDLTQIEQAKQSKTVNPDMIFWAELIKASSMEELETLVKGKEAFEQMVFTMKKLTADEAFRMQCEAIEDYERTILTERQYYEELGREAGERIGREAGEKAGKEREIFSSVQERDYSLERGAEKLKITKVEFAKQMDSAGFQVPEEYRHLLA